MGIGADQIVAIIDLAGKLYADIITSEIPPDAPYIGGLPGSKQFALTDAGYASHYHQLFHTVAALPVIGDAWSESGIRNQLGSLIYDLAMKKATGATMPDLGEMVLAWLLNIDVQFPETRAFVPVIGLSARRRVSIGSVTFEPLDTVKDYFPDMLDRLFFDELFAHRDCISSGSFQAEAQRAVEKLRGATEEALHVLRFVGSLVWHGQPIRHLYIAGHERRRVSYSLCKDVNGGISSISDSAYTPLPFTVDDEFLALADYWGLSFIQELIEKERTTQLEGSFLTAIRWFGEGPTPEFRAR
jgi:hypothetical protein